MVDTGVAGRTVLIAGASGASGIAIARALAAAGARVLAVGRGQEHLDALAEQVPDADTRVCDLTDPSAVAELAMRIHVKFGSIDGLVNLVGGWRGGGGLAGQSDEDWRFLEGSLTSLRNISRTFYDDLVASTAGRLAIVSSTAVEHPTAGGANYVALKAAAEAWTLAVAQGFAKAASAESSAAATIFRVKSLAGLEESLAASVVGLWSQGAASINGRTITIPVVE
ncbi:SDR family NAD(P)-dependent oxidoreductase [Rathayibacter soli]|uniref:SDR family NAD(P)-dependent oxidoreductase n=1 Tax=Rathayibacter soli TaxID=3144168 RepID=UPI0027E44933|nr:SDR family NAD(P)-dependent oxidoreductase [Glaciibacter superstes]